MKKNLQNCSTERERLTTVEHHHPDITVKRQCELLYIPASESNDGVAQVIYEGKNSGVRETFVALGLVSPACV